MRKRKKRHPTMQQRKAFGHTAEGAPAVAAKKEPRRSWWLEHPGPEGFTEVARREVRPLVSRAKLLDQF
jgi:hypothetical protein